MLLAERRLTVSTLEPDLDNASEGKSQKRTIPSFHFPF